jgi:hypothetical protein
MRGAIPPLSHISSCGGAYLSTDYTFMVCYFVKPEDIFTSDYICRIFPRLYTCFRMIRIFLIPSLIIFCILTIAFGKETLQLIVPGSDLLVSALLLNC